MHTHSTLNCPVCQMEQVKQIELSTISEAWQFGQVYQCKNLDCLKHFVIKYRSSIVTKAFAITEGK